LKDKAAFNPAFLTEPGKEKLQRMHLRGWKN